jgi:hypothetical protein
VDVDNTETRLDLRQRMRTLEGITDAGPVLIVSFKSKLDGSSPRSIHLETQYEIHVNGGEVLYELSSIVRTDGKHFFCDTFRDVCWNPNGWIRCTSFNTQTIEFKVSIIYFLLLKILVNLSLLP